MGVKRLSRWSVWLSYAAGVATLFGVCVRAAVAPGAHGEDSGLKSRFDVTKSAFAD